MLRKDNMQPQTITHEFKTRWDPRKERMVAESQRYDNRLTRNFTVSTRRLSKDVFLTGSFSASQHYLGPWLGCVIFSP